MPNYKQLAGSRDVHLKIKGPHSFPKDLNNVEKMTEWIIFP